jgi:hypothetical protein
MHPTSFTRHSSHKVTNEMYIIKTKHKSSVNKYCIFQGRVHTMVTKFTSKQHENYIPNRNMSTWIYLFTKLKALDKLFSHKSMFKGQRHFNFEE